jgi:hypothetical protein
VRRFLCAAAAAISLSVVAGCSGTDSSDSAGGDAGAGSGVEDVAPDPAVPAADVDDEDRQVVTTASASVAVDDPADAAQQVSELVESAGGRVEERSEFAGSGEDDGEGASADLVVRVPSDELTGLLADLADVGDVESRSVSRSDVTSTAVDLDARISALQTSVARLQTLIDRAASTGDLLAAEKALSDRQGELESLQSQRALLADQVELSTLEVHLQPSGVAPAGGPDGFVDGLGTGWRALTSALGAAVVVLGVLLPWLVVAAVVGAAVLVPLRMARRRAAVQVPPQA